MTTFYEAEMKCAVCGKRSKHPQLGSTNTMGWPDLDTRPAEMQRSTMGYWVVECPGCGYCASDLEEAGPNARTTVAGEAYRALLADTAVPELARRFLGAAAVLEADRKLKAAGWSAVHAAWACDEEENGAAAAAARNRAVELFEAAIQAGEAVFSDGTDARALTTDLLRRAGRFEEARAAGAGLLDEVEAGPLRRILKFQLHLIEKGDTGCYTIGDAREWKEGG